MRELKLTNNEKQIEKNLLDGTYKSVSDIEFNSIANSINKRKKQKN